MLINLKDNLKGARVKDKYNKHGNIVLEASSFLLERFWELLYSYEILAEKNCKVSEINNFFNILLPIDIRKTIYWD